MHYVLYALGFLVVSFAVAVLLGKRLKRAAERQAVVAQGAEVTYLITHYMKPRADGRPHTRQQFRSAATKARRDRKLSLVTYRAIMREPGK